jgi:DNA polymerase elongation subunit (family B)
VSNFYTNVTLYKDKILVRGYQDGQRYKDQIVYRPRLFEENVVWQKRGVPTRYKTIHGKPVYEKEFDNVFEARKYVKENTGIKKLYGLTNYAYTYINDTFPGEIEYDPKLINVVSLDIETDSEGSFPNIETADKVVTAITIRSRGEAMVFGLFPYTPKDSSVTYIHCESETDLLNRFVEVWNTDRWLPDIVTGWNVEGFDIPYLVRRISRILSKSTTDRLSPWRLIEERDVEMYGKVTKMFTLVGISVLDYLQLYRKFMFSMSESYKLDYIASVELGETKLDYSEYDSLHDLYVRNFEKFIDYNIHDVVLVDRLDDKLKFIEQVLAIAYDGKVNFVDAFTSVRMWDVIIHNYLLSQDTVVHMQAKQDKDDPIVGAYVKDPQIGMHNWVVSFDLNSLYPHLIMQYNISPEMYAGTIEGLSVDTILDGVLNKPEIRSVLDEKDLTIAATGCLFRRDQQGFLPTLMQRMYDDRVRYKKQMLEAKKKYEKNKTYELEKEIARCHNMQLAKKIQLNSAYGALSNIYFRWFAIHLAESITKSGQLSIRWMEKHMNQYLNKTLNTANVDYVITCDTDSMYIKLDKLVAQTCGDKTTAEKVAYIDKICGKVFEPYIDTCYDKLAHYVNAYQQKMQMKREAIADKGIYTAKKRYILNVYNLEGVAYDKPKLKIQGIEAVRSSTPSSCRESIKKALSVIMNGNEDDVIKFISDFRDHFNTLSFEEIAFPRSVRGLDKYRSATDIYKSATPMHVKGALIYNHMLELKGIETKYQQIGEGEKIRFCYLTTPLFGGKVIAAPGDLPKELKIASAIDYDTQFDKAFLEPLRTILDAIGWKTEHRATIEDFF